MNFNTKNLKTYQVIFALFLLYFSFQLTQYHFHLIIFPYSAMLREGAMMMSTHALVKGLNPYSMALQPSYANDYGIIYPLLAWPLAKFFGTTLLVHRIVTAFFILLSCVLIFLVLKKMKIPVLLNIWAILMFYASLLYPNTSTAGVDPGATGSFFYLATIFIPWLCRYSYKSLIISVLCGILAFYTKPYTMLGIGIISTYLFLFISKSKSLFYGILFFPLMLISIEVINQIFPAYFDNCFFVHANLAPTMSTMERLFLQINLYAGLHKWILLLLGTYILWNGCKNLRNITLNDIQKNIKEFFSNIKFNKLKEPLIKLNFPLVIYAGLCSSIVLYMFLGRHNGAILTYFFQLLSPFLLIATVLIISQNAFWPLWCIPFLLLNLHALTADLNYKLFYKDLYGWPEMSLLVSQHKYILNSPLIAPMLIEQNKEVFDDGLTEYSLSGGQRNYWMKGWLKEDNRIFIQRGLFFDNIRIKIDNRKFDLIMLLSTTFLPSEIVDDIKKYYKYEGLQWVYTPQDHTSYIITVWKPN